MGLSSMRARMLCDEHAAKLTAKHGIQATPSGN